MRNAVTRRPHKERSQPSSRAKWGLLEKHKDYSLRAADFNSKKKKLSVLTQKSREKHPDEFSFGMLSQKGQGKHGQRGDENRLSHDAVQLLKTQDAGYLRNAMQRTRREVEKTSEEVGMDGVLRRRSGGGKKVVYGDDGEPEPVRKKLRRSSDISEDSNGDLDGLHSTTTVPTTEEDVIKPATTNPAKSSPKALSRKQLEKEKDRLAQLKIDRKRRKRMQELRAAKLEVLKKRQKEILAATNELELQRAKMGGTVGGVNRNGVKFKVRERKR